MYLRSIPFVFQQITRIFYHKIFSDMYIRLERMEMKRFDIFKENTALHFGDANYILY